jgi:O-antigen biosynthesis protein
MQAALIIINHNGRQLLERGLPGVVEAAAHAGGHAVAVADDGSTDDSLSFVSTTFPEVSFQAYPKRGFGATCNRAVAEAETEAVVLLNSDIVVAPDFLDPLLAGLAQPDVFAVSGKFLNPDGSLTYTLGNRTSGEWRRGLLYLHHETEAEQLQTTVPQLYANGGAIAVRRDWWQQLGGFDGLYAPFYWEDADLGYRAWGRGWRVLYEPASVVYHEQGATIGQVHRAPEIELISARNALLFAWKNLLEGRGFARAVAAQARWTADDVLIGGLPNRGAALRAALRRLPMVAGRRRQEQRARVVTDGEILARAKGEA